MNFKNIIVSALVGGLVFACGGGDDGIGTTTYITPPKSFIHNDSKRLEISQDYPFALVDTDTNERQDLSQPLVIDIEAGKTKSFKIEEKLANVVLSSIYVTNKSAEKLDDKLFEFSAEDNQFSITGLEVGSVEIPAQFMIRDGDNPRIAALKGPKKLTKAFTLKLNITEPTEVENFDLVNINSKVKLEQEVNVKKGDDLVVNITNVGRTSDLVLPQGVSPSVEIVNGESVNLEHIADSIQFKLKAVAEGDTTIKITVGTIEKKFTIKVAQPISLQLLYVGQEIATELELKYEDYFTNSKPYELLITADNTLKVELDLETSGDLFTYVLKPTIGFDENYNTSVIKIDKIFLREGYIGKTGSITVKALGQDENGVSFYGEKTIRVKLVK